MKIEEMKLFQDLSREEIERSLICSASGIKQFRKNEYIFRQEEKPDRLYFILSGEVILGQINVLGRQTYIEYLKEGQCFGETDLFLERKAYSYFAFVRENTEVLSVSSHFFYYTCEKNCSHHSRIIFNMMRIFADETDKAAQKIKLLTCGTIAQRVACYLMQESGGRREVRVPMNREDLAVYLNTTRPSLSRELSRMQKCGIFKIKDRKSVQILDFNLLQDEIDGLPL